MPAIVLSSCTESDFGYLFGMAKKISRGRPKLPKGQSKAAVVVLRLQPAERKAVVAASKRAGLKLSEWARSALMLAANDGNLESKERKVEESNPGAVAERP